VRFAERGTRYAPVFENERLQRQAKPKPVFYAHGFLPDPRRKSHGATDRIVLSEDDYHDLYRDVYAWANIVQLTLLLNYTALFVGHSLCSTPISDAFSHS
jgi:SIR2-like domain